MTALVPLPPLLFPRDIYNCRWAPAGLEAVRVQLLLRHLQDFLEDGQQHLVQYQCLHDNCELE